MTTAVSYLIESADSTEDMNLIQSADSHFFGKSQKFFMIEEPARTTAVSLSVKKKRNGKKVKDVSERAFRIET